MKKEELCPRGIELEAVVHSIYCTYIADFSLHIQKSGSISKFVEILMKETISYFTCHDCLIKSSTLFFGGRPFFDHSLDFSLCHFSFKYKVFTLKPLS